MSFIDYFGDADEHNPYLAASGIEKHFREQSGKAPPSYDLEYKPPDETPCTACGCPTFNPRLCNLCFDVERTVKTRRWFVEGHDEWKREQERKKKLITGDGYI